MHYMVAILLVFAPVACLLISLLSMFVVPKFKDVFCRHGHSIVAVGSHSSFASMIAILVGFEMLLFLALLAVAAIYIGGPGFVRWFQFRSVPVVDWITWRIPWKQKKLQRAFSAMLAVLLDGGVPEAEAVRLAGESTANEICRRRARRVIAALEKGAKLDDAVRAFDDTGEFHWRLTNATHAHGGFLNALRGWHEALDAKAFQQEETATHVLTSGLVILNGAGGRADRHRHVRHADHDVERHMVDVNMKTRSSTADCAKVCRRPRGFLEVDLLVGLAILSLAVVPLGFSFARERQVLKMEYFRSVANEIVDGEMEILAAGDGKTSRTARKFIPSTPGRRQPAAGTFSTDQNRQPSAPGMDARRKRGSARSSGKPPSNETATKHFIEARRDAPAFC